MTTISAANKKTRPGRNTQADVTAIKNGILQKLFCNRAKFAEVATVNDFYLSLAAVVRDRLVHRWTNTAKRYFEQDSRTVVYLSAEYLLGPQLGNNLINLGIYDEAKAAVEELGLSFEAILESELEPGLGNGGLGRLAACFLDSMATQEIPTIAYGIRYEFGIFHQDIKDGWQVETADRWLKMGNPWEIHHPEIEFCVNLGGRTMQYRDDAGNSRARWIPERITRGSVYETFVPGYGVNTANVLRLWKADAYETFDLQAFNTGDYYKAMEHKVASENISRVLYPSDETHLGKTLRLEQEYFFVSCSLQDMIRIYQQKHKTMHGFHKKYSIQLNDTHPSIAVAELMRLLIDVHGMEWDDAWEVTSNSFAYTNHTLLAEALEKWPLPLFSGLLPRLTEIIYEINERFLQQVRQRYPGDNGRVERMSLIEEGGEKRVRMAHLACVGCRAINGVAALHTDLLKRTVLADFNDMWPEKFSNKTNGVTPRRFMALANMRLARLITGAIGDKWINDAEALKGLEPFARDAAFRQEWVEVKRENKQVLADYIKRTLGIVVDPHFMFDVQVKRIHEYKRQHLNVLRVVSLYQKIKDGIELPEHPRTVIFGGKAAPSYYMAKLIIKLINSVADVIRDDAKVREHLQVVFLPNFNVTIAQQVYPAAELSEQISTAGKEASGTGNMKFGLNGALTIGTLDGANIEIRDAVGEKNFFLFGMTAEKAMRTVAEGYRPMSFYEENKELRDAIDLLESGRFSGGDASMFLPLTRVLKESDPYMLMADFPSYMDCQRRVGEAYTDVQAWTQMSIMNVSRMGRFSSDRAVLEYAREIWKVQPVKVALSTGEIPV